MVEVKALRSLLDAKIGEPQSIDSTIGLASLELPGLGDLLDEIEADGHGLVMVLGKGGVGKTTIAAAIRRRTLVRRSSRRSITWR